MMYITFYSNVQFLYKYQRIKDGIVIEHVI